MPGATLGAEVTTLTLEEHLFSRRVETSGHGQEAVQGAQGRCIQAGNCPVSRAPGDAGARTQRATARCHVKVEGSFLAEGAVCQTPQQG